MVKKKIGKGEEEKIAYRNMSQLSFQYRKTNILSLYNLPALLISKVQIPIIMELMLMPLFRAVEVEKFVCIYISYMTMLDHAKLRMLKLIMNMKTRNLLDYMYQLAQMLTLTIYSIQHRGKNIDLEKYSLLQIQDF